MTENKDKHNEKDKEKEQEKEKDKDHERNLITHLVDAVGRKSRNKSHSATMVTETEPSTNATTPVAGMTTATSAILLGEELRATIYMTNCVSFQSEIFSIDVDSGEMISIDRQQQQPPQVSNKDETLGTQRVFKKTSPNCTITLYLPTREIVLSGSKPSILRGIVFVDPKTVQGYRIYAQLTLTFRYGREDEEVMGLRFCNEAIMSLHQVWPRAEEPSRDSLSPLQDALVKRLGEGAHPFTLNLTPQAPPSVQLVPAKRYYGAPIGTSYDVRCFIADKTEEKFHRRASVKMGVRVIYRTDVHHGGVPENFAALINSQASPPVPGDQLLSPPPMKDVHSHSHAHLHHQLEQSNPAEARSIKTHSGETCTSAVTTSGAAATSATYPASGTNVCSTKPRKSERGDSFPKLRLSPKSFRFSGRFGRSKSEIEKCPADPFYNYSKSFQEYECGGPQGAVDKPFLLQEGRVSLRASLDKAWYTHGENVIVNVNIRNDSRKTVRKVRVCAIQHVDVCMFNNGKFKNIVADSDNNSPVDRTVSPGSALTATFILKPQRGPTKNWIALEDTLQRSTEPEEITGAIAASAIRSPTGAPLSAITTTNPEDRNVFAIYVSYYVKVKLSLSGMGGELSLKLPFVLVHVDEPQYKSDAMTSTSGGSQDGFQEGQKLALANVPAPKKNNANSDISKIIVTQEVEPSLDRIESIEDDVHIPVPDIMPRTPRLGSGKRKLIRSETVAKDLSDDDDDVIGKDEQTQDTQVAADSLDCAKDIVIPRDDNNQASDDEAYDEDVNKGGSSLAGHQQIICAQVHSEV